MIYTTLVDVDLWEGLELCQFARGHAVRMTPQIIVCTVRGSYRRLSDPH
jgi:hypothetical protein